MLVEWIKIGSEERTWIIDHILMVDGEEDPGGSDPRASRNLNATAPQWNRYTFHTTHQLKLIYYYFLCIYTYLLHLFFTQNIVNPHYYASSW